MKLISTCALIQLALTASEAFAVSSQNIMRINQRLVNGRSASSRLSISNRPEKTLIGQLLEADTHATALENSNKAPNSPSQDSQIIFNNTLPNRFQIDLEEERPNIVKILYEPQYSSSSSTGTTRSAEVDQDNQGNNYIYVDGDDSDSNTHVRFDTKILEKLRIDGSPSNDNENIPKTKDTNSEITTNKKRKTILLLVKGALNHKEDRERLRKYYAGVNSRDKGSNPAINFDIQLKFLVGRAAISEVNDDLYRNTGQSRTDQGPGGRSSLVDSDSTNSLQETIGAGTSTSNSTTISAEQTTDYKILQESKQFNDIIIGDFFDNYENLVLKSLLGLEWYTGLPAMNRPEYLLMVDDDVDVRLNDLMALIRNKEVERKEKEMKRLKDKENAVENEDAEDAEDAEDSPLLLCPWKNAQKARVSRRGPWAVPVKSYPATHWPSYCGGACYLMNYDAAKKLHDSAKKVVAIDVPIEDAFITGILRERANFSLESTRPVCVHNYKKESVTGQFVEKKQEQNGNNPLVL